MFLRKQTYYIGYERVRTVVVVDLIKGTSDRLNSCLCPLVLPVYYTQHQW